MQFWKRVVEHKETLRPPVSQDETACPYIPKVLLNEYGERRNSRSVCVQESCSDEKRPNLLGRSLDFWLLVCKIELMTSCGAITRATSPICDEQECCIDMLHHEINDNTLPLITMMPQMPAAIKTQDRPVVLYMAPIHKQQDLNCPCGNNSDNAESTREKLNNVRI
ncbi:unnamed protein product [Caenorhabditis auriculariae]|uniref:Uncharacterized protein n=1 Tax=Caenorhabditis auriculariae TaxID=2777116 RepID=A0A8S1GZB3_9PELO|nr:unnamed protein product [Caenorhabditis auriculariae]